MRKLFAFLTFWLLAFNAVQAQWSLTLSGIPYVAPPNLTRDMIDGYRMTGRVNLVYGQTTPATVQFHLAVYTNYTKLSPVNGAAPGLGSVLSTIQTQTGSSVNKLIGLASSDPVTLTGPLNSSQTFETFWETYNFSASYTPDLDSKLSSGQIMEGTHAVYMWVTEGGGAPLAYDGRIYTVSSPSAPRLLYPTDGQTLASKTTPDFRWAPVSASYPISSVFYRLRIVEVLTGQSAVVAMRSNAVYYEATTRNLTQHRYDLTQPELLPSRTYAWQVASVDAEGEPLSSTYESEVFSFITPEDGVSVPPIIPDPPPVKASITLNNALPTAFNQIAATPLGNNFGAKVSPLAAWTDLTLQIIRITDPDFDAQRLRNPDTFESYWFEGNKAGTGSNSPYRIEVLEQTLSYNSQGNLIWGNFNLPKMDVPSYVVFRYTGKNGLHVSDDFEGQNPFITSEIGLAYIPSANIQSIQPKIEVIRPTTGITLQTEAMQSLLFEGKFSPKSINTAQGEWRNAKLQLVAITSPATNGASINSTSAFNDLVAQATNNATGIHLLETPITFDENGTASIPEIPLPEAGQNYWVVYRFIGEFVHGEDFLTIPSRIGQIEIQKTQRSLSLAVEGFSARGTLRRKTQAFSFKATPASLLTENYLAQSSLSLVGWYKEVQGTDSTATARRRAFNEISSLFGGRTTNPQLPNGYTEWVQHLTDPNSGIGTLSLPFDVEKALVVYRLAWHVGLETLYSAPIYLYYDGSLSYLAPEIVLDDNPASDPVEVNASNAFTTLSGSLTPFKASNNDSQKGIWKNLQVEVLQITDAKINPQTLSENTEFDRYLAQGQNNNHPTLKTIILPLAAPNSNRFSGSGSFTMNATSDYQVAIRVTATFEVEVDGVLRSEKVYTPIQWRNVNVKAPLTLVVEGHKQGAEINDHYQNFTYEGEGLSNPNFEGWYKILTPEENTETAKQTLINGLITALDAKPAQPILPSGFTRWALESFQVFSDRTVMGGTVTLPNAVLKENAILVYRIKALQQSTVYSNPIVLSHKPVNARIEVLSPNPAILLPLNGGAKVSFKGKLDPSTEGAWQNANLVYSKIYDKNLKPTEINTQDDAERIFGLASDGSLRFPKRPDIQNIALSPNATGELQVSDETFPDIGQDYWVMYQFYGDFSKGSAPATTFFSPIGKIQIKSKGFFNLNVLGYAPRLKTSANTLTYTFDYNLGSLGAENFTFQLEGFYKELLAPNETTAENKTTLFNQLTTAFENQTTPTGFQTWTEDLSNPAGKTGQMKLPSEWLENALVGFRLKATSGYYTFYTEPAIFEYQPKELKPRLSVTEPISMGMQTATAGPDFVKFTVKPEPVFPNEQADLKGKWESITLEVVTVYDQTLPSNTIKSQADFEAYLAKGKGWGAFDKQVLAYEEIRTPSQYADFMENATLSYPAYKFARLGTDYWVVLRFKGVFVKNINGLPQQSTWYSDLVHYEVKEPENPPNKPGINLKYPSAKPVTKASEEPLGDHFAAKVNPLTGWSQIQMEVIYLTDKSVSPSSLLDLTYFQSYFYRTNQSAILNVSKDAQGNITYSNLELPNLGTDYYAIYRYVGRGNVPCCSDIGIVYVPKSTPKLKPVASLTSHGNGINNRTSGTNESFTGQITPYLQGNTDKTKGIWQNVKFQMVTSKNSDALLGELTQTKKGVAFYQGAFTKLVNTAADTKSGLILIEVDVNPDATGGLSISQFMTEHGYQYSAVARFIGTFISERDGEVTEQTIATTHTVFDIATNARLGISVEGYTPNMVLGQKNQDFEINSVVLNELNNVQIHIAYYPMPDNATMSMSVELRDLKSAVEGVVYGNAALPTRYKTWTQPIVDFKSGKGRMAFSDSTVFRAAFAYWVSADFNEVSFKSNPVFLDLTIPRPEPKYNVAQIQPKTDEIKTVDAGSVQTFRIKTSPWDVYNDQKTTDRWDRVSMQVVYVWDDYPTNVVTTQEEFNKLFNEKEIRGTSLTKMRTEEVNARWLLNGELEVPSYAFQEIGRDYWVVIRFRGVYLKGSNAFGTGNQNEVFSKPVHFKIKTKATFSASMKNYKKRMAINKREQVFEFEADPPNLLKNVELIGLYKNLAPEDTSQTDVLTAFRKMDDAFDEMEEDADESPDGYQYWQQTIPNLALKSGTLNFPDETTERAVIGFVLRGNVNGAEIYTEPLLLDYNLPSPSNRIFTVKTKVEVKDAQNVVIASPEWDQIKPELRLKIGRQTKTFKPNSFKDGNLVFAFKLPIEAQPTNKGATPLPFTLEIDGDVNYTSVEETGTLSKRNADVPTITIQGRKAGEYTVAGLVKDSDSDPVPNVALKIAVDGLSTPPADVKTDATGKFKFTVKLPTAKVPTTSNSINFTILPVLTTTQKLLYKPSSQNGALDGRDQTKLLIKLKSLNASVIAGTLVSKGAKKPVRMAEVAVYEAKNPKHRIKKVMTDEDGRFLAVGLLEGEYVLKLEKTGYKTIEKFPLSGAVKVETGKKSDLKEVQMELKPLTVKVSVRPKKGPLTQEQTNVYVIKKTDLNQYQEWRETNPLARFETSGVKVVQQKRAKLDNKPVSFTFNDVDIERTQDSYIFISSTLDLNDALGEQTTPMDSVITIRQTAFPSIYLKGKVLKQGSTTGLAGVPLKLITKQNPPKVFTAKTDENGAYTFCLGGMTAMDCSAAIRDYGFTVAVVIAPKVLTSKDPAPPDKALYSWDSPDVDFPTDVPDFSVDAKWISGGANPTTPLPRPNSNTVWSSEEPELVGKVTIKVRSSGQAVAGASVAFGDNEAETNDQGEAVFEKVEEDSYDLTVTAPDGANYAIQPTSIRVTYSSRSNPVFEITQEAQTGMEVSGQVVDQDNKPVAKANVYVKGNAHIATTTKDDGSFSLSGVVGVKAGAKLLDPVLVVDGDGYGLNEQTLTFKVGGSQSDVLFKVTRAEITEIYGFRVKYRTEDITKTTNGWTIKAGSLINIPSNARVKFDDELELPFNNLNLNAQKRPSSVFSLSLSEVALKAFGFEAKIFNDTGLLLVQEDSKTKKGYIKGKIQFKMKEAFQGHTFSFMVSEEPWPAPAKCDDTSLCITAGENLLGGPLEYEKGEDFQFGSASGQKVTKNLAPNGKSHFLQDAPISIIGTRIDEDGVSYTGRFKLPEVETGVKVDLEAAFADWGFNPKKRSMKFPNIDDAEASIEHEASGRFLQLMISNLKLYDDGFYLEEGSAIFNTTDSRNKPATGDVTEGYEFTFRDCMLRTKDFAFRVGELEIPNDKALKVGGMALSIDRIGFGYEKAFYFRMGGGLTLPKVNNAVAINELGYDGRTQKITMDLGLTQPINIYSMKLSVDRLDFNYSFSTKAMKLGFEGAVSLGSVMSLGGSIALERKSGNWDFAVEKITGKASLGPVDVEDITITLKDGTVGGGFKASVMKKLVFGASFMWQNEQNFAFSGTFGTPIPFGAWTFERATLSVSRAFSTWNVGMTDVAFSSGGRSLTVKGGINVTFGGGSTVIKVTGEVLLYQESTQVGKAEVVIDTEVGITGSVKITGFSDPSLREMVAFKREPNVSFAVIWGGSGDKYWYFGGGLDVTLAKLIDASAYIFIGENADGLLSQASSIAEKFPAHPKGKLNGIYAGGVVGASFNVWPISAGGGIGLYFLGDVNAIAGGFYYSLYGGVDLLIISGKMGFTLTTEMNKTKGQALYINGTASAYVRACLNLLFTKICKSISISVYARTENGSIKYGLKW
ncbi:MAG: carboxypeptidase regulatory-like domain-containing protein [Rhodothermia bacterium]|nr:carboxypeptidase regulatory-like domain-containing protein [Rhodothermia bacterium]